MKRLIVVYNPRSSRSADVQREVLSRLTGLRGYLVGKYEVQKTSVEDNIATLTKLLKDGDLVISAGGDATGVIASNAILQSGKDATLAALPYGNFNDLARTLGSKDASVRRVVPPEGGARESLSGEGGGDRTRRKCNFYPLEVLVDGKHWRYVTCYVTIGMTAEAVNIYEDPKLRKKLRKSSGRQIRSYTALAGWYFRHRHKKHFIPSFTMNGIPQPSKTSDYFAVNGSSVARIMRSGEDYLSPTTFHSTTARLTNLCRLTKFMSRSIFRRIPGAPTTGDILEFAKPSTITLQSEGEPHTFHGATKIEILKSPKPLRVITSN